MKRYTHILTIALLAFAFGSCEDNGGNTDTETGLKLTPSKTTVTANGVDKITFTLMDGTEDVTSKAEFFMVTDTENTKLEAPEFTTKRDGTYKFKATYASKTSDVISVSASGQVAVAEKYFRRICIMKFTGTWCQICPDAGIKLDYIQSTDPERIIQMALHGGQADEPMIIPETQKIFDIFKPVGYPAVVIDFRSMSNATSIAANTNAAIDESKKLHPATCGIRISSQASNGTLKITTGVTSNTGGNYRVAVYVMESGLVYGQKNGGLYIENYKHNHVTRQLLSSGVTGDSLGTLIANTEKTKEYTIEINPNWKLENLNIVAYVVDAETGYINNAAECKADNGSVDYKLNV